MSAPNTTSTSRFLAVDDQEAANHVFELSDGLYRSQCLYVVCDLGIPDIVVKHREPISVATIVENLENQHVDAGILTRVMRYISLHGVFHEVASDDGVLQFGPTKVTEYLSQSSKFSGTPYCQFWCGPSVAVCGVNLNRLVKKEIVPRDFFKTLHGRDYWEYLKHNQKELDMFHRFSEIQNAKIAPVVSALAAELEPGLVVLDVGGGSGYMMKMLKEQNPDLRCINFDLPEVISQSALVEDVEMVAGDFFKAETFPKADVIVMKHILHDWDDGKCLEILTSCRSALPEGGRVICVEAVLESFGNFNPNSVHSFRLDLTMMMLFGSKERYLSEWSALFLSAGFELSKCIPVNYSGNDFKLLVARKRDTDK